MLERIIPSLPRESLLSVLIHLSDRLSNSIKRDPRTSKTPQHEFPDCDGDAPLHVHVHFELMVALGTVTEFVEERLVDHRQGLKVKLRRGHDELL